LEDWIGFIESRSSIKGISRDQWNQLFKFAKLSIEDESLRWHNEEQSWPALIDEFVAHVREMRGDEPGSEDDIEMEY
jgi:DCN1-like protein 1/2